VVIVVCLVDLGGRDGRCWMFAADVEGVSFAWHTALAMVDPRKCLHSKKQWSLEFMGMFMQCGDDPKLTGAAEIDN